MMAPPPELLLLAALLFANRMVVPSKVLITPVYVALQAMNVAVAFGVGWAGIRGLEAYPVVKWLIVILLGFHVAQNASARNRAHHDREMRAAERERVAKRAQLRADAAVDGPNEAPPEAP